MERIEIRWKSKEGEEVNTSDNRREAVGQLVAIWMMNGRKPKVEILVNGKALAESEVNRALSDAYAMGFSRRKQRSRWI